MKRIMLAISAAALAAGLFVSCEKTPQDNGKPADEEITVSMKADAAFAEDNTAKLTLELSKAASVDVTVTLAKAPVQSGKNEVPANFSKSVKIEKGKTSAEVNVEADVLGLESGEYQTAIKIASVKGAETPEDAVVYIALSYSFKPEVNVYADQTFAGDKTAKIRVALAKATTKDVKVKLAPAADNKYTVTIAPAELTIAAGQTEAEAVATIELPESVEIGVTPHVIDIVEVENAVKGKVTTATINLAYPFSYAITIDGDFSDWDKDGIITYSLPEGAVLYPFIKKMKLAADEKYAYLYFEFADPAKCEFYNSVTKDVAKATELASNGLPINIYIDADGNKETGCYIPTTDNQTTYSPYANDNMGVEWYLEGGFHGQEFFDLTGLTYYLRYTGKDKDNFWSSFANHVLEITGEIIYAQSSFDESAGIGRSEISFQRKFFEMTGNKARFSVKIMDGVAGWPCLGLMPQGTATDMKKAESRSHVDMATLILPNYVE